MNISTRRKSQKNKVVVWVAGILILSIIYLFSIYSLSDSEPDQKNSDSDINQLSQEQFIERIATYAQELQSAYGILPSVVIGQAILESNWGQSTLASEYNNLFGMKAYGNQLKINLETQEYINEEWITIQGDFKIYNSWEESMDDHTQLFLKGVDWNPRLYEHVLLAKNYKEAAQALQDAGYATDPTYAQKVIDVIESYDLAKYDN